MNPVRIIARTIKAYWQHWCYRCASDLPQQTLRTLLLIPNPRARHIDLFRIGDELSKLIDNRYALEEIYRCRITSAVCGPDALPSLAKMYWPEVFSVNTELRMGGPAGPRLIGLPVTIAPWLGSEIFLLPEMVAIHCVPRGCREMTVVIRDPEE